ncbi:MAG TPA: cadherin domain-containing protein, partial [Planctomycetaceae bacterium]
MVQWSHDIFRRLFVRRTRLRSSCRWPAPWAAMDVLEARAMLSAQVLSPVVEASIEDANVDGKGDSFVAAPFNGLLRQISTVEDRAVSEFNVAGYSAINSATLNFNLAVNNYFGGPTRTFNVSLYSANGQADLTDFSAPAVSVGNVTLVVANSNTDYQLNVASAVQSLKAGGATNIGVRLDPVDNSSPSIYRSSKLTVDGTLVVTNNPPTIAPQTFSIAENSPNGTLIGQVQASEPDAGQSLGYSITSGNELGLFAIDAGSGRLTVANGSQLDYEAFVAQTLTVTVTDNGVPALSASAAIRVNLLDQNDNAPVILAGQSFLLPEDAADGTAVGTVQVSDRDTVGGPRTFSIVGGNDAGIFAVNAATGQITVADNTNLNYDVAQYHDLALQVSDGLNLSAVQTVRINVQPL